MTQTHDGAPSPTGAQRTSVTTCIGCGRRNRVPVAAPGRVRCSHCRADLPWLVEAGDADFDAVAKRTPLPVLVDVWAPWCGPCRTIAPMVEHVARERAGTLKVVKVNADQAPSVTRSLGISGIPTLVLMADGVERARVVGARSAAELRCWLDDHLPVARTRPSGV